ncbi:LysR substrate-binding domain-containing protein [Streptomyces sp. NPDC088253]|uniref:LysR substrate-binding domain-containing protein n=1 Tax=Streptomyces sp. NPDC088253 TaxID=3365846 RepID=UPI00381742E7
MAADTFGALLPADHPLAAEPSVAVDELEDDTFLFVDGGCARFIRRAYQRAGVPFRPTHRVSELPTLVTMVRAGVGVSVVPALVRAMLTLEAVFVPLRPQLTRALFLTGAPAPPWPPHRRSCTAGVCA